MAIQYRALANYFMQLKFNYRAVTGKTYNELGAHFSTRKKGSVQGTKGWDMPKGHREPN